MTLKRYTIGATSAEAWHRIHNLLTFASSEEYVPDRSVTCTNSKSQSATRSTYELTEEEANNLQNDSRISYIDDYDESNAQDIHVLDYEQSSTKFDKGAGQNAEHINCEETESDDRHAHGGCDSAFAFLREHTG